MPEARSQEVRGQTGESPAGPAIASNVERIAEVACPAVVTPLDTRGPRRRLWRWMIGAALLLVALAAGVPWVRKSLSTVSTDDAYVNGHVTFVAPRVPGKVVRVLVDDNNRVRKGQMLVELDREPYQVQVNIAQAAMAAANADLVTAQAQARANAPPAITI